MLKPSMFKSRRSFVASSLLALLVMAFGSAAYAQSDETRTVQMPDEIVDVEITPATGSRSTSLPGETPSGLCEQPEHWLYAKTYEEGDMASHGGKVWVAVKTTEGDMPGMNEPPFWQQVKDHCSVISQ